MNMTRTTRRLVLLLAAMDLHRSDLFKLINDIRNTSDDSLYRAIRELQEDAQKLIAPSFFEIQSAEPMFSSVSRNVAERVARLLKDEARLSNDEAAKRLSEALIQSHLIARSDVPPLSKKSFFDWISRLANLVTEKDLLRAATLVRNQSVNSPNVDWKLR